MYRCLIRLFKNYFCNEKGNALIEYALIIAMLASIIFAITAFSLSTNNMFNATTCQINCTIAGTKYTDYLNKNGITHSEDLCTKFILNYGEEICPGNNEVTYVYGRFKCRGHISDNDDNHEEPVPFL